MDLIQFAGDLNLLFPLLLLLLPIFILILKKIPSKQPPLPPGPYPWPLVGNILQMAGNDPLLTLTNLARTHGPLISLRLGTQLLIVGSSPAAAREILKTNDRQLSGRFVSHTFPANYLTIGTASECNDQWKHLRAISRAEIFSSKRVESLSEIRQKKVMEMVRYLISKEGEVVNLGDVIFTTVCNTLSVALLSTDVVDFEGKGVGADLKKLVIENSGLGIAPNFADFYPLVLGRFDIQGLRKKTIEVSGKFFAIWEDIIKQRREQRSRGVSSRVDFLDALIEDGLTNDQINHLFLEMFSASTDTTSSTIEWAIADLVKNQGALHKLGEELVDNNIAGTGDTVTIQESQLLHLPYLQACIKESVRLHPPGPLLLPHRAIETCQVMNYTIPKDSQIIVNTFAISRDPVVWTDPLSFSPERFLESGLDFKGNDFELIPFGSGRRICPGLPLAARQVPLILASLIHLFDWSLPGNKDPAELEMNHEFLVVLHKEQPLQLVPKQRK